MLARRTFLATSFSLTALPLLVQPAFAAKPAVYAENGIAINGFDPVAYFIDGKPL